MRRYLAVTALMLALAMTAHAGWKEFMSDLIKEQANPADSASSLTVREMTDGLREALNVAVKKAVAQLSAVGGYLDDPQVRIPLPDSLATADKLARKVGLDSYSDQFIETMNKAAEEAAGETTQVFVKAISEMTIDDAKKILDGPDDAATKYFEKHSSEELTTRIRPLVEKATTSVGVTNAYKTYASKLTALGPMVSTDVSDLDGYVTDKAIDGLFTVMAAEEKKIREDPVARTTELLKKVFGSN